MTVTRKTVDDFLIGLICDQGMLLADIDELKGKVKEIEGKIQLIPQMVYESDMPDDDQWEWFFEMYFKENSIFNPSSFYKALSDNTNEGKRLLFEWFGDVYAEMECNNCHHIWKEPIRSRNKWDELHKRAYVIRCPQCKKLEHRQFNVQVKQQNKRLKLLKSMPYAEYLQTPEWQETRKAALKRARYHCQVCNGTGTLDVHHRTYERKGEEHNDDLIVLCRKCHSLFHENGKVLKDLSVAYEVK